MCLPCAADTGVAASSGHGGGSARAEAERRRHQQEERHQGIKQAHPILGGLALTLAPEPEAGRSWAKGAAGEERLATWLDAIPAGSLLTLHDRRLPGSKANIDHLVVTAIGVWVIDANRYGGVVEKRDLGGWLRTDLRLFVRGRDRSPLVAAVGRQVDHVECAVAGFRLPAAAVRGVLCFVDADWRLFAQPFIINEVLVTWPKAVRRPLLECGPHDRAQQLAIHRQLAASFPPIPRPEPQRGPAREPANGRVGPPAIQGVTTCAPMTRELFADAPDFTRLYGRAGSPLSPRMACLLWTAAVVLADTYSDPDFWDQLKDGLPPLARRMADEIWMARFATCFEGLATRLASGRFEPTQLASCTGEEMALHLVIDTAQGGVRDDTLPIDDALPADDERDSDFDLAREVLFRDHDVLLPFNEALDGIDDPDNEISRSYMFANLHPRRWFLPFADQFDAEP